MPSRPIQAAPETTTAPAQTTGRLVLLAASPSKAAASTLYLSAPSPRCAPQIRRSSALRRVPAAGPQFSDAGGLVRPPEWPIMNFLPAQRNLRERRRALDAALLTRSLPRFLLWLFGEAHKLLP